MTQNNEKWQKVLEAVDLAIQSAKHSGLQDIADVDKQTLIAAIQDYARVGEVIPAEKDRTFRDLYENLAKEYCAENTTLYTTIAPLLGLKPFYGTCNKEQVIWAESQEQANALPAGASIHTYIKQAINKQREGE